MKLFEGLDRVICSIDWRNLHPEAATYHLPRTRSNHAPILLNVYRATSSFTGENPPLDFRKPGPLTQTASMLLIGPERSP